MRIKKITSQHRNDYTAVMECEHCGHEQVDKYGYDDANYHDNVIPPAGLRQVQQDARRR